jgi:hypothetical protein
VIVESHEIWYLQRRVVVEIQATDHPVNEV